MNKYILLGKRDGVEYYEELEEFNNYDEAHNLEYNYRNKYNIFKIRRRNITIKCPKCSSFKIELLEQINTHYIYSWTDNFTKTNLDEDCNYIKVIGMCIDCGKKWTFRKIKTKDELKWK